MRGYDTIFVQRMKTTEYQSPALRKFVRACIRNPQPIADLAAWFGVSRTTVYNWMTGRAVPRSRHLAEMKRVVELIRGDMLTGSPTRK